MNLQDIRNPHRIYPGQQLFLDKSNGRARLRMGAGRAPRAKPPTQTVRVSPRTRLRNAGRHLHPTLQTNLIEPFLAEPSSSPRACWKAPRIVATQEGRVLLSRGDRAYARGTAQSPLVDARDKPRDFRVFRNATALRDPVTRAVLGYEAQYVGKARWSAANPCATYPRRDGKTEPVPVPATIDIVVVQGRNAHGRPAFARAAAPAGELCAARAVERALKAHGVHVRLRWRLRPEPDRGDQQGHGRRHRKRPRAGHPQGRRGLVDRTGDKPTVIKLPDERNGLLMVFRPFEKLSYALILEITDGVKVGDRVVNPR
jgi:hypothetical protein